MGLFVLFFAVFCKLFPINSLLSFQRIYIDESLSLLSLLVNVCSFHFERLLRSTFSLGACGFFLMFTKAKVITPSNIVIIFLIGKVNYCLSERYFSFVFRFRPHILTNILLFMGTWSRGLWIVINFVNVINFITVFLFIFIDILYFNKLGKI